MAFFRIFGHSYCIIFCLLLFNKGNVSGKLLCPASSLTFQAENTSFIKRHSYPLLFFPHLSNEGFSDERNCTLPFMEDYPQVCYNIYDKIHHHCPVTVEQVDAALNVQSWPSRVQSFCRLKSKLLKVITDTQSHVHELNVAILGGSMPHGSDLEGRCCCFQNEDSRCPSSFGTSSNMRAIDICKNDEYCTWVTLFTHWLELEFPHIRFRFHRQTIGGIGSAMVPSLLGRFLRSVNWTENDIIFLDYSVNDAFRMPIPCSGPDFITSEFELMIRHLLRSVSLLPTIIVLEQYPHGSPYGCNCGNPVPFEQRIRISDYGTIYRQLSKHYNLTYWSSRESYWTHHNLDIEEHKRYPLSVFETAHINTHPPWFIHTYLADLYASLFMRSIEQCDASAEFKLKELPPSYLNETLYANEKFCHHQKIIVEIRPWRTGVPGTLTGPDALLSGWREYADHRNIPGYIITNYSNSEKWTLSFPFEESNERLQQSYVGFILLTKYLRSYENMGRVEIGICGRRTGVILDGLDIQNHVSIPHNHVYEITPEDNEHCLSLPHNQRSIDYIYLGPHQELSFSRVRHHRKMLQLSKDDELRIRGIQKFKILGVDFCVKDNLSLRLRSRIRS